MAGAAKMAARFLLGMFLGLAGTAMVIEGARLPLVQSGSAREASAVQFVNLQTPKQSTTPNPESLRRWQRFPDVLSRPTDKPYGAFTVAATGDLLIHSPVRTRAATPDGRFDFAPQLSAASMDVAAADLGLCHLEVPLDPDGPYSSYPVFNAPAQLAEAIATTGWDVCSTASNHSADQGMEGLVKTLDALDSAGVQHRGMFRTEADAKHPRLYDVNGTAVGLLSATYGLNGLPSPGGYPWSVQLIDSAAILQRVRDVRAEGAEVVIVSLHWGNEYQHEPSQYQRQIAAELMTGGEIDAIIGHHAHVIQPVEWIDGRPVVYGLGNFLSGQRPSERRDGAIVTLQFNESHDGWSVDAVHAQPTWVDDGYAVVAADADQPGALGESAQRTLSYLGVPPSPDPRPPQSQDRHYLRAGRTTP